MIINEIIYQNFKCFQNITNITCNKINLFTGVNGRGKSTALQGLLLLKQSIDYNIATDKVYFNGNNVRLGNFEDVKNRKTSTKSPIKIKLKSVGHSPLTEFKISYHLTEDENDTMVGKINRIYVYITYREKKYKYIIKRDKYNQFYIRGKDARNIPILNFQNLWIPNNISKIVLNKVTDNINLNRIHYISADRIGPKDLYPKESLNTFPTVGSSGEFTANILAKKRNERVYKNLVKDKSAPVLLDQTSAWLNYIFEGGRVNVKTYDENIISMQLNSDDSLELYKALNVGFGYSYTLPIIVSGLIAKKGDIIVVENPEAHIHPMAQSRLTEFLIKVCIGGVQVFIESHSEHVLNAFRVAVKLEQIKSDEISVNFFQKDEEKQILNIPIRSDGKIFDWPKGFFDQTEKDFEKLFGL